MNREQTVRGYRILGDKKPERELSFEYLKLSHEGAQAQTALREAVAKKGANCVGREDVFSGDTLMDDRDGMLECAGCPSFAECDLFRLLGRPAYGTFAGHVIGRGLMEEIEEEFNDSANA